MKRYRRDQIYEPRHWEYKPQDEKKEEETITPTDTTPIFQAADEEPEQIKEVVEEPKKNFMAKVVNVDHLRIRQFPDANSGVVGMLNRQDVVKIAGDNINDFYPIVTAAGIEGFCSSQFLLIYEEGKFEEV